MLKKWYLRFLITGLLLMTAMTAHAAEGVITLPSAHDVATTVQRLTTALEEKGMKLFAQVDHAAGASGVGLSLRPTYLVIFGNPNVGTKLMQCAQTAGLDLPMKALIWQDEEDRVWLSYNDPEFLAKRHAAHDCAEIVAKMQQALAGFARAATAGESQLDQEQEIFY